MNDKEQLIITSICNIITAYAAWEHDEVNDKEFKSQITSQATKLGVSIKNVNEILEHASFMKFANVNV